MNDRSRQPGLAQLARYFRLFSLSTSVVSSILAASEPAAFEHLVQIKLPNNSHTHSNTDRLSHRPDLCISYHFSNIQTAASAAARSFEELPKLMNLKTLLFSSALFLDQQSFFSIFISKFWICDFFFFFLILLFSFFTQLHNWFAGKLSFLIIIFTNKIKIIKKLSSKKLASKWV